mmetsp:Transcript_30019/g.48129  ORF Transcript_30019/g.48129 Transcript_30019/m.48129 type:complete len:448 (+) Transcript_30019:89-1432(+)
MKGVLIFALLLVAPYIDANVHTESREPSYEDIGNETNSTQKYRTSVNKKGDDKKDMRRSHLDSGSSSREPVPSKSDLGKKVSSSRKTASPSFPSSPSSSSSSSFPKNSPPISASEPPRGTCKMLDITPSVTTCGVIAGALVFFGLLTTFWDTRSPVTLGFWVGFVLANILTLVVSREVFQIKDDDLILLFGIIAGMIVGIASTRVLWIAHSLSAVTVTGLLVYCGITFGPFFAKKFGNHWWLWAAAFVLALPVIIYGWALYRVMAFVAKTAFGALLVTIGMEYFVLSYSTMLNRSFSLLRLLDGSHPDECHGSTCILTLCFWLVLTLIGSFVHNFGVVSDERSMANRINGIAVGPRGGGKDVEAQSDRKRSNLNGNGNHPHPHHGSRGGGGTPGGAGRAPRPGERVPLNYTVNPGYDSLDDEGRVYGAGPVRGEDLFPVGHNGEADY